MVLFTLSGGVGIWYFVRDVRRGLGHRPLCRRPTPGCPTNTVGRQHDLGVAVRAAQHVGRAVHRVRCDDRAARLAATWSLAASAAGDDRCAGHRPCPHHAHRTGLGGSRWCRPAPHLAVVPGARRSGRASAGLGDQSGDELDALADRVDGAASDQAWPWFWVRNVGLLLPLFVGLALLGGVAAGCDGSPRPVAVVRRAEPDRLPPVRVEQHQVLPVLAAGRLPADRLVAEPGVGGASAAPALPSRRRSGLLWR